MTTITTSSQVIPESVHIPYVTADEAHTLMGEALERFLKLVETLAPEDWDKPTACTAWSVRDMLAHQAGGYASGTGYREMIRQYSTLPQKGQLPEDAINDLQVRERAGHSPTKLIAELRQVGPVAIQKWAYQFRLVKPIAIPHPVGGLLSLRHLMWIIHSRDTWMHRMDICRAADRPFEQTREHDGRIVELVVLDTAKKLTKKLNGQAITLSLTGMAGGTWQIGKGEPAAEMEMDALDFNIFVSGRFSYEEGMKRANISGDTALVKNAFKDFLILY